MMMHEAKLKRHFKVKSVRRNRQDFPSLKELADFLNSSAASSLLEAKNTQQQQSLFSAFLASSCPLTIWSAIVGIRGTLIPLATATTTTTTTTTSSPHYPSCCTSEWIIHCHWQHARWRSCISTRKVVGYFVWVNITLPRKLLISMINYNFKY